MSIPKWRLPQSTIEGDSLVLDAIYFLSKHSNSALHKQACTKLVAILAVFPTRLSQEQFASLTILVSAYRNNLVEQSRPLLNQFIDHFSRALTTAQNSAKTESRSLTIWLDHRLVLWHLPGLFGELNPDIPISSASDKQWWISFLTLIGISLPFVLVVYLVLALCWSQ